MQKIVSGIRFNVSMANKETEGGKLAYLITLVRASVGYGIPQLNEVYIRIPIVHVDKNVIQKIMTNL